MEVDNAKFLWSGLQQYRCQIYFGGSPLPLKPKRFIWFQTLVREIRSRRAASDWLPPDSRRASTSRCFFNSSRLATIADGSGRAGRAVCI